MILENSVKKTLKAGGVVLGTMLTHLRQPAIAVLMKNAGGITCFLMPSTARSLRDCWTSVSRPRVSLPTIVRVPNSREAQRMYQTLDLGASGLLCPQTESKEQVEFIIHSTNIFPWASEGCPSQQYTSWANTRAPS